MGLILSFSGGSHLESPCTGACKDALDADVALEYYVQEETAYKHGLLKKDAAMRVPTLLDELKVVLCVPIFQY